MLNYIKKNLLSYSTLYSGCQVYLSSEQVTTIN